MPILLSKIITPPFGTEGQRVLRWINVSGFTVSSFQKFWLQRHSAANLVFKNWSLVVKLVHFHPQQFQHLHHLFQYQIHYLNWPLLYTIQFWSFDQQVQMLLFAIVKTMAHRSWKYINQLRCFDCVWPVKNASADE